MRSVLLILLVTAIFSSLSTSLKTQDSGDNAATLAIAANFLTFRSAALKYISKHPGASGEIPSSSLSEYLPLGFSPRRPWKATVISKILYVWGNANSYEISAARDFAHNPFSIGTVKNGIIFPNAPLPIAVPANIPDGSIIGVSGV